MRLFGLTRARRTRVELVLLGTGVVLAVISLVLLAVNSVHLKAMLTKYANLNPPYQLSQPPFDSRGLFEFVRDYIIQNALAPTIFLALSVLAVLAFAVSVVTRALKTLKVRLALVGEQSIHGSYRLAVGVGTTFLTLAILPGAILASASEEATRPFSEVEKSQTQVWSEAEAKLPQALRDSLNAHAARGKHQVAKMEAQMDCRGSSSARTYYAGDSISSAGVYNSCRLSDYLDRTDSRTEDQVWYADYFLDEKQKAVNSALATLNAYKGNVEALTFTANIIRSSQLTLFLIAGVSLILTFIAAAMQLRGVETTSASKRSMVAGTIALRRRAKCPKCAESVKSEALICKHCGAELHQPPAAKSL